MDKRNWVCNVLRAPDQLCVVTAYLKTSRGEKNARPFSLNHCQVRISVARSRKHCKQVLKEDKLPSITHSEDAFPRWSWPGPGDQQDTGRVQEAALPSLFLPPPSPRYLCFKAQPCLPPAQRSFQPHRTTGPQSLQASSLPPLACILRSNHYDKSGYRVTGKSSRRASDPLLSSPLHRGELPKI